MCALLASPPQSHDCPAPKWLDAVHIRPAAGKRNRKRRCASRLTSRVLCLHLVTEREIKKLLREFKLLDVDGVGLTREQALELPQLKHNPLSSRMVEVLLDQVPSDRMSFRDFVLSLAVFAPDERREAKLKFAFKVYDLDNDNVLGRGDLVGLLRALTPVGGSRQVMNSDELDTVVDNVLEEADQDGDGAISYEEFQKAVDGSDFHSKLSLDML